MTFYFGLDTGETFRVLKEKENKLYGEYRTRRLVLEAWERLEGETIGQPVAVGQPAVVDRDSRRVVESPAPRRETVTLQQPKQESSRERAEEKPAEPASPATPERVEAELPVAQPTLTDFGLYKCGICGKMVMGYEKESHQREKHGGKSVEWKKMR